MKLPRFISSTSTLLIAYFRRIKLDNFVGGLIIGALFSLLINVFTVQTQEILAKQRALEALEREIVQHLLDVGTVFDEEKRMQSDLDEGKHLAYSNIFSKRLDTRVWESAEAFKYIFQLDPDVSAELTIYYGTAVDATNQALNQTQRQLDEIYDQKCRPLNSILDESFVYDRNFCDAIVIKTANLYGNIYAYLPDNLRSVLAGFRPTQHRLDSFWLKLLLGSKSVEVLKGNVEPR